MHDIGVQLLDQRSRKQRQRKKPCQAIDFFTKRADRDDGGTVKWTNMPFRNDGRARLCQESAHLVCAIVLRDTHLPFAVHCQDCGRVCQVVEKFSASRSGVLM